MSNLSRKQVVSNSFNFSENGKIFQNSGLLKKVCQSQNIASSLYNQQQKTLRQLKSAVVYDLQSKGTVISHRTSLRTEVASLTKIMTCWIAIKYIRNEGIVPEQQYYKVSKYAGNMKGTTAELQQGDNINLWDLLHGLMLPSGNDAAVCIAQNIGNYMKTKTAKHGDRSTSQISTSRSSNYGRNIDFSIYKSKITKPMKSYQVNILSFVQLMNQQAQKLGMGNTQYNNPHGLADPKNYSTCQDQILLISQALKDPLFIKIVNKKLYFSTIQQKQGWNKQILWENTNRLLLKGYQGIKTGITQNAGYCLASWYKKQESNIVLVVLGAKSRQQRDQTTVKLTKIAIQKIKQAKNDRQLVYVQSIKTEDQKYKQKNRPIPIALFRKGLDSPMIRFRNKKANLKIVQGPEIYHKRIPKPNINDIFININQ